MTTTTRRQDETFPEKKPMDRLLIYLTLLLICVGIFMVYSASYAFSIEHYNDDSFHYVKRQALWVVAGFGFLVLAVRIPYWRWREAAIIFVALAAMLLVAVLVPHVGISIAGARRWVGHGAVNFQPSEFAKLALVLYLARVTAVGAKTMRDFRTGLLPPLLVIGALAGLIAKEPDMGTAIVLSGTGLIMLCLAGARLKHLAAPIGGALLIGGIYAVSKPYRLHRLSAFLNPQADRLHTGYQAWHALIALGSGGLTGFGLGEGREKLFLPEGQTDMIFPVIAEEWGLIGTLALIVVYMLVAWRGFTIAYRTKNTFGMLLASGLTILITVQALLNISVATGSLPETGVPLPFISYGGSSLVLMMTCIGLLLNISRYPQGPDVARDKPESRDEEWDRRWNKETYIPRSEGRPPASTVRRLDRAKRRTHTPVTRD
jgi:cell division protein FtsW